MSSRADWETVVLPLTVSRCASSMLPCGKRVKAPPKSCLIHAADAPQHCRAKEQLDQDQRRMSFPAVPPTGHSVATAS